MIPRNGPNSMNNYGVVLDDFGFSNMLQQMIQIIIQPLSMKLWKGIGEDQLDEHHGFTVEYGMDKDKKLDMHVDDSEITVNYCLGT